MKRGVVGWMVRVWVACCMCFMGPGMAAAEGTEPSQQAETAGTSTVDAVASIDSSTDDYWGPLGPVNVCFDVDAAPSEQVLADIEMHLDEALSSTVAFNLNNRWPGTNGDPITLTWSLVPDGVVIPGSSFDVAPCGAAPSDLFATLDAQFGTREAWLGEVEAAFERWAELSGVTFVRVTFDGNDWDDGAVFATEGDGVNRGDIRIGGRCIDGEPANDALGFAQNPSDGNIVLDSANNWGAGDVVFFRNAVAHQIGHALGIRHVCPNNQTKLMEPLVTAAFDGPQHDDMRAVHAWYGDPSEIDNDAASANDLGTIPAGSSVTVGSVDIPAPALDFSSLYSIDSTGEADYFAFTLSSSGSVNVSLVPIGHIYDDSNQIQGICQSGDLINSASVANLAFAVVDSDGVTDLVEEDTQIPGNVESISEFPLAAGTYYVRVFSSNNHIRITQMYDLTVTANPGDATGACCDECGGGCTDDVTEADCVLVGGAWFEGQACSGVTCPGTEVCDDGLFCNGAEACDAGSCVAGSDPCPGQVCDEDNDLCVDCLVDGDCDDGVDCTVDACGMDNLCTFTPDDTLCDNGLVCDGAEFCDAALGCQPGTPVEDCCDIDADCDDGIFCNGDETCVDNACVAGTPPTCDDGVSCTTDACDVGMDMCVNTPDDGLCDNGMFCDGTEVCDALLGCQAGTPVDVDDGVSCTVDSCDEENDVVVNTPDDGLCDNGMFCDGTEVCDALLDCQAGTPVDVDDGVDCTIDSCDEENDVVVNTPDDLFCDNGLFCDGAEVCDALLGCQAGTPVDVDDGVSCTVDSCDEDNDVVVNMPDDMLCDNGVRCDGVETCDPVLDCQPGTPIEDCCKIDEDCDDGLACNGLETCDAGTCVAGTPIDCNDDVDCTIDTCDEDTDSCVNTPDDTFCDDGLFCNGLETCDAVLGCQPGTPVEDCCEVDADCDDGIFCNGEETCVDNACVAGTAPDCDDMVDCTVDACDVVLDECTNTPDDGACDNGIFCDGMETCDAVEGCVDGEAVDCGDGVDCTVDACDEDADACVNTPDDAFCDDGLFCTGVETCDAVLGCQPGMPVEDCCDVDADCDDGLFCNGTETCVDNVCMAGTPVDCGDGVECTIDTCDEDTDMCLIMPDDTLCDDGLFCNGMETCDAVLGCLPGTPVEECCEVDADCDDGLFCNGTETCVDNVCMAGTSVDCNDDVDCTVDSCDEDADACVNTPDDASCDDGLFCNGMETCDALLGCQPGTPVEECCEVDADCDDGFFCNGTETCVDNVCVAGTPVDCNDDVECTVDSCDDDADACVNTPDDASCDDGLFCNGMETCDALLGCQPGTPVEECCEVDADCDDGFFCNGTETCVDNVCMADTPVDCNDDVSCTVDSCDEGADTCINTPVDAFCDDGLFCTGAETCDAELGCQPGEPVEDCCDVDADCDDGLFCNGTETCEDNTCVAGTPVECDDGIECTIDACDEDADACANTPDDAVCDDGVFCNGPEVCDVSNGCEAGSPPCDTLSPFCNEQIDSCITCSIAGDQDDSGSLDLVDYAGLAACLDGPEADVTGICGCSDLNEDGDVDLRDFARFQLGFQID